MIVGHAAAVAALRTHLPPVTLLTGPASVGKQTLADHLADHHHVAAIDRRRLVGPLTAETARGVIAFVATAPFGPFKYVSVDLDAATAPAMTILLKTLEQPPATARFMLLAAGAVLPTVVSRAQVFPLGLLTTEQLTAVLTQQGASPGAARRAAAGHGQVLPALAGVDDTSRTGAVELLRAVLAGDQPTFDRAVRGVTDDTRELLRVLLVEAITGRLHTFHPADLPPGVAAHRRRLYHMIHALGRLDTAGARIGVRAALEPFLTT